ncbi:MAG TPA: PIN domain-containing protein [Bryobacteraceae bacterium]|jgi:predicted nucleic acid-binding protein
MILDANILIRAVLGSRVPVLLRKYAATVELAAPDTAFAEARGKLPGILLRRRDMIPTASALATLDALAKLVLPIEFETYGKLEMPARQRIERRDENDWPVLATALALDRPIWTEDLDFFGCGWRPYFLGALSGLASSPKVMFV